MVRCTNSNGVAQPDQANWNPAGFMRNVMEATSSHRGLRRTCHVSQHAAARLLLGAASYPSRSWPHQPTLTLKSVKVDLPESDRMFPGPGADAINNNCLGLPLRGHGVEPTGVAEAAWQAEVNKMINVYKAPSPRQTSLPIVDYLGRTKGAPK